MSYFDYSGKKQNAISFPLGGIGSGCIGLSGTGRLIDWEIFNRPNKNSINGFTHFAVRADDGEKVLSARVLCADERPDRLYSSWGERVGHHFGHGAERSTMGGFPHFPSCTFEGKYPFARLGFETEDFPGRVELNAFAPFIPTNEDDSSIPAAFFAYTVTNTADKPLNFTLAGSVQNPFSGEKKVNSYSEKDGVRTLRLTENSHTPDEPQYGDLTLATDAEEVSYQEYWYHGNWFDNVSVFWTEFTRDLRLKNRRYEPDGKDRAEAGTVAAHFSLEPGESKTVRFVLAWNVPTFEKYWDWDGKKNDEPNACWKNWYATRFADSTASAVYALKEWSRLEADTRLYQEALFSSSLPETILDAISATVSVLKSPTVLRLENGSLYGWEGCGADWGSCEGSCSHVWAYTYAMPYLFPRLERSMRDIEYKYTMDDLGGLHFRVMLPLGTPYWSFRPCADGQFATVFKTWREYCICGDAEWLKEKWPDIKKSVAYAWNPKNPDKWDPERSGVLTGRQHHTLDMELFGANSWLTSMYLCALRAAEEMAKVLGENDTAAEYRAIFEKGAAFCNEQLFNGEYFIQKIDLKDKSILEQYEDGHTLIGGGVVDTYWNSEANEIKYQIQNGCAIDQVLGQWHADLIGLGDLFDREKVNTALRSVYRNNFVSMRDHVNPCRLYCLNGEKGALICSFPNGRPMIPVPYAEETMHGFEYQAAVHMTLRGMADEGTEIAKSVRDRYDGEYRNPWNEMECGSNYARNMATYGWMLAYSGMTCDMGRGFLGFRPLKGDGRFMWSLDSGFGTVEFKDGEVTLSVLYGKLELRELGLPAPAEAVGLDGKAVAFRPTDGGAEFPDGVTVKAGGSLAVRMAK